MDNPRRRRLQYSLRSLMLAGTLIFCPAAALFGQAPLSSSDPQFTNDDAAVYAALFKDLYDPAKDHPIFLIEETAIGVPPGLVAKVDVQGEQTSRFLSHLSPETKQDYTDRNKEHMRLPSPCRFAPSCVVGDITDLAAKVKNDRAWRGFFKKYPNSPGLVVVSRIGFNRDHTEAVVYTGRACGSLCGEGEYARLVKLNGSWVVDDHTVVWLSQK